MDRVTATLVGATTALFVAYWVTGRLIGILSRYRVVDTPNQRSSHTVPTPRGGGIGLLIGLLAGLGVSSMLGSAMPEPAFLVALLLASAVGLVDDIRQGLPLVIRLVIQTAAAGLVLWSLGPLERLPLPEPLDLGLGWWGWPLGLLWFLGVVNLVNFLDGIDGFAAGQAILAGIGITLVGGLISDGWLLTAGAVLAAASAGFLRHNWSPARIFLGDVGSTAIGFFLAGAPWLATRLPVHSGVLLVALLTWFFLADGTFTILRRILRGERFWAPHRSHLYQRQVRTGLGHARVTLEILALALVPASCGILGTVLGSTAVLWSGLVLGVVLMAVLWRQVVTRERLA